MSEFSPELPVDPLRSATTEHNSLIQRISDLEAKAEKSALDGEAEYRSLLIAEICQRIWVRYAAILVAVLVVGGMAYVAAHVINHFVVGPVVIAPSAVVVATFVGPIVSISAITIMLLLGAFRRFKDDDMDKINVTSLAVEAAKSVLGK